MTVHRPGARVCARTGLVLVPSAGEPAYRVALSLYGPLNPPARGPVGADVSSWSRYDTYDGRTVYTASTRGCAFDEVLAGFRRWLGARDSLAKDAAAVGLSVPEFLRAVEEDWADLGVMLPGHLPRAWRTARLLYTVTHPRSGWWVILDTAESIAVIRSALGERLAVGAAASPTSTSPCCTARTGRPPSRSPAGCVLSQGACCHDDHHQHPSPDHPGRRRR